MAEYLFVFGFESPRERLTNKLYGADDESSCAFFVEAEDQESAIRFGERVAEAFVDWLFAENGEGPSNWLAGNYARWIEPNPERDYDARALQGFPRLIVGESMPARFDGWWPYES